MKKLIALFIITAIAAPAMASITWDNGNQGCTVNVTLNIPAWAQVVCQDPDGITFSSNATTGPPSADGSNNGNGDWYQLGSAGPHGYYSSIDANAGNKASTDPWAGAEYITSDPDGSPTGVYYEATDYAHHYIRTNTNITGTVSCNDLASGGNTIPTYFTLGFAPFWNAGSQITTTSIPYDGQGAFGQGTGGTVTMDSATPHAFASGTNWQYNITAPAFGTITIHCRILRKGMMDVAGSYTATITVSYQ
jgi:hypothetical protein